jgi:ankyrin repeat protein
VFVDGGANTNGKDEYRNTHLHDAASSGKTTMVKFLIERKADVLACARWDNSTFSYVGEGGRSVTVRF